MPRADQVRPVGCVGEKPRSRQRAYLSRGALETRGAGGDDAAHRARGRPSRRALRLDDQTTLAIPLPLGNTYDEQIMVTKQTDRSYHFVDLFCGAGGMTLGFHQAGLRSVFAIDHDAQAINTYRANFGDHALCGDIRKVENFPQADVVIGGPPCQGFSRLGKMNNVAPVARAAQNGLWREYFRCVAQVRPKVFVIENVANISKSGEFDEILAATAAAGYQFKQAVLNAADYGVPQRRERWFLIASRIGVPSIPLPTHAAPGTLGTTHLPKWRTVRDAIADLPLEPDNKNRHDYRNASAISIERYKHVPPGGNRKNLPDHLTFRCWREKDPRGGGSTDLFGRLHWDAPSLTIRTEFLKPEKGCYLHPEANRSISVREGARLQTFPDDFVFASSNFQTAKQIGNAVPPRLALAVAVEVLRLLRAFDKVNFHAA